MILSKQPILIVDGYNFFIRHMMVNETVNANGEFIGGIIGFLRGLNSIVNQLKPCGVIVVWEQGGPSLRRKALNPKYKANRTKDKEVGVVLKSSSSKITSFITKEQKIEQLKTLAVLLNCLPVCQLYVSDTECDDIIAWLVEEKYKTFDAPKVIVSNDKDFYQLLSNDDVVIFSPATKSFITKETVLSEFNIAPEQIVLARAVAGDPSDNLDGVAGIGLPTMAKRFSWLQETSNTKPLEFLFDSATKAINETKKPPKCFADILSNQELIKLNYKLMLLSSSTLSSPQKEKLNYQIENFIPRLNQLDMLKNYQKLKIPITDEIGRISENWKYLVLINE